MSPRPVLFLTPDLEAHGGIASHARSVASAISELGLPLVTLALHDRPRLSRSRSATHTVLGCAGRRPEFALRAALHCVERPALVVAEHPSFAPLALLVARTSGAPAVVFGHGIDIWTRLTPLKRHALRLADRVVCVSRFTADRAISSNGLRPEAVCVIHNCIALPEAGSPPARNGRTLLSVSRLSESELYKGHSHLIRALPRILSAFPDVTYDIVGDGSARPILERLAVQAGVSHATTFHGSVSDEALSRLYSRADVFVLPSSGEGFGIAFAEAMAHGLPVVGGNADATPEVVSNGRTGLLVDPTSEEQVASAVLTLLGDRHRREAMGRRAAQEARERFAPEDFKTRFVSLLRACMSERGTYP